MKLNNKLVHYIRSCILAFGVFAITLLGVDFETYAAEFTVTDASGVLYTVGTVNCYMEPDAQSQVVTVLGNNLPVQVTGVTSNGWFRIELNGSYYVMGTALTDGQPQEPATAQQTPTYQPQTYMDKASFHVNTFEEAQAAALKGLQMHASTIEITTTYRSSFGDDRKPHDCAMAFRTYAEAKYKSFSTRVTSGTRNGEPFTIYTLIPVYYSTIEEEILTDAMVEQVLPQVNAGSDYDKIKAVHDFVCNQTVYASYTAELMENATRTGTTANLEGCDYRSAYDALFNQQTVCTGYALLFQKFMERMGIPCYSVKMTIDGLGHMLNLVQLDGQWYSVDCTWDDQNFGIIYTYFLRGASRYGRTFANLGLTLSPTDYRR